MTSADAKALAAIQHSGQVDKAGLPYIGHVERVAAGAERRAVIARNAGLLTDVDAVVQAAWLHDVVEDTPITLEDLADQGFGHAVILMVDLLTKPKLPGTYADKLRPLLMSGNLGAILVKLADNEDNSDPSRALVGGESLLARYAGARVELLSAAERLGYVEG